MLKIPIFIVIYCCCTPALFAANELKLRVVSEHFPPLQIWDKEQKTLTGMAVDVIEKLLALTDNNTEIEILPWARAYELALTRPNTLIFTIIRTKEREPHFKWLGSITPIGYNYIWTLKSRSDIKIDNWQDAKNYYAVAQRNGAQSIKLASQGFKEQENLYLITSYGQGILMVLSGRADFFLGSDFLAGLFLRHLKLNKQLFTKSMPHSYDESLNIAFSKQTPDAVVNEFRKALEQIRQDGTLQKIVDKWTQ